jgi:hypothetical protein
MIGGGAFPGSSGRAQQDPPEATGEADGGRWGRLGDLAMEAEETGVCSFFPVALAQSSSPPHCSGRPHHGPICPCRHQVGSRCAAASATRTALKHGLIAAPCALLREGSESYKDDAHLTDIYSFPGYQVEIEVPTNPDGS